MPISTQNSQIILLTEKLANLEKRVAALEAGTSLMIEADGSIDLAAKENLFQDERPAMIVRPPAPVKRGRRSLIPLDQFSRRRDDLIVFIEIRWPDLEKVMGDAKSAERLMRAMKKASPGAHATWGCQQLTDNLGPLWEF